MTILARRLYYLSAIIIFAVLGPLIVLWTDGFRWAGWDTGFQQTGALHITSDPRAELYVDQRYIGTTPQRFTHITPGNHEVELRSEGLGTWSRIIRIHPDAATVIGPVLLLPETVRSTTTEFPAGTTTKYSPETATLYGILPVSTSFEVRPLKPESDDAVTLPFPPTRIVGSRNGRMTLYSDGQRAVVVDHTRPGSPWSIAAPSDLHWDEASVGTFYGLHDGRLARYDVPSRTITDLTLASSVTPSGSDLWLTQVQADDTAILKQRAFGQSVPDSVFTLPGRWLFIDGPPGVLLVQDQQQEEVLELRYDQLSNRLTTYRFGEVDMLWWTDRSEPPLWIHDVDLFTRDAKDQRVLVDRYDRPLQAVQWIVPNHVVAIVDDRAFTIASVSNQQGRGMLLNHQLPDQELPLDIDPGRRSADFLVDGTVDRVVGIRW